ncbi:sirohydrochlorin chelatase [Rhodoferax sp. 4810]|uniref:Sirohydrochlorin chelatase n=1 Tax=Thiospirillum jenense TaxID=1653858 RepID=A0A839HD10_9GAMM|nr:sirohydrochlorin chelatase [Thiospirillum jenense]MBB1075456.1 sirohydrochlorin chelatase [Rhodoferax jenense]MBB1126835.1 sirohydrochlorin chelatase [Thiospirillum jenense]
MNTAKLNLLIVGHGTRFHGGNSETHAFIAQWQLRHPSWQITTCFIEYDDVLLDNGLDQAAAHASQVRVIPLILNAARHVKLEIPAAIAAARIRHPQHQFECAPHLGMGHEVCMMLQRQLQQLMTNCGMPDPRTTGVILLGRGSSDASANGQLAKMARWLFEDNDHELIDLAFTGITWPRLETVVQRQIRLDMKQIMILPAYLFAGRLTERIALQVERLRHHYPTVTFALAQPLGTDTALFDLLDKRACPDKHITNEDDTLLLCDGCPYQPN